MIRFVEISIGNSQVSNIQVIQFLRIFITCKDLSNFLVTPPLYWIPGRTRQVEMIPFVSNDVHNAFTWSCTQSYAVVMQVTCELEVFLADTVRSRMPNCPCSQWGLDNNNGDWGVRPGQCAGRYITYTRSLVVHGRRQPVAQPPQPFPAATICGQTDMRT